MKHFRLAKDAGHFRPAKGWKRELEEISLSLVIAVLLIVSASAAWAGSQARNMAVAGGAVAASQFVYYGKVITSEQCTTPLTNGPLCTVASRIAPFTVMLTDGKPPLAAYMPGASKGVVPVPVPGGYVIGFGIPGGAAVQLFMFWMFAK
ncbi:hypothetical protein A3I40_00005 [Candidatus Uhrbacteria bacterium RIFCSPLOWO2_02_FULL_48_12]|uniref:Uncharacterized protein n=1 Tax=Candidatus Uhrbacteria bacterium RIFCSPLOWO2_02_FULL_48_12 TaxID=1802407 RepID=A0A1F7V593_9BACT|nr:MAG: hypothetical protein A3I40_00005 [Candidatus Uhrbacteria bacterium RIFCSPLOWO2_02_FULL_48_12]